MIVIIVVVVVLVVMMCIEEEQNLYWFCSLIRILRKKSWYVIAGSLFILPIYSTDYFYYCSKEFYMILS